MVNCLTDWEGEGRRRRDRFEFRKSRLDLWMAMVAGGRKAAAGGLAFGLNTGSADRKLEQMSPLQMNSALKPSNLGNTCKTPVLSALGPGLSSLQRTYYN